MIGELIPTGVTYGIGREALNDQFSGTGEFNNVEVSGNLSAGTGGVIYSGGTDLYNIFGSSSGNYLPLTVTGVTIVNVDDTDLFFTGNTGTSITTVVVGGTGGDQNHFTQVADGYASIGSIHSGNSDYFYVVANQVNGASLEYNTGTTVNLFKVTKSTMRASSTILTFPGITYDIDYSANYTNRSLVDKQYVVNTIATATTASNGLTKSGNNITLGGTLTGNTSIDVNGSYLNFVNTNPTTIAGDYKYRFLDGVTTPTIATENVSNYTEFKPITTGGAYQFASGVVMYANPSGNTNSEFYAGADLTLITTDLNKFQDSVAASLSILQFASNTGTFSGGFVNAHTSTFRNLLSGNNIQNLAHYQAFGIETDGTNASVIDNLYGFYMRNSSDGNITNKWGVYIDDPNANNYFAGNVDVDGILTSGGTDLYNIFNTTASNGLTKSGDNITLGGQISGDTIISLSGISTFVMSGDSGNSEQIKIQSSFINSEPASLIVGKGSAGLYSEFGSSSVNSYASVSGSYAQIGRDSGATTQQINITDTGMKITDSILTQGLIYDSNYHANYTNRSLIDKEYVDLAVASGGGGVQPYINVGGTGATITWNVSGLSTNYQATLVSATTTINLTGVRNGEYGTIIVTQDGVGGRTVTFGTVNGLAGTHKVVNGGGGAPTLTSTASATDILSFTYNGSTMYWTVGNDYT
jgi:hypothetical protein